MIAWNKVKERLPPNSDWVLIAMPWAKAPHWNYQLAYFRPEEGWIAPNYDGIIDASFWLEIPKPPVLEVPDSE